MVPFGRHTSVKLKKIFADCRVPREERIRWPVVCTGDDVLWVVGLKRSALAPVTELTREVMILKVLRGENGK
jgi:tRNA(Ile)-lysidine synthase